MNKNSWNWDVETEAFNNKIIMYVRLVLLLAICLSIRVETSQDVVQQMAINFAKPLEACKKEFNIPDTVIQDLSNFWKEDYELKNKELGCVIICLAAKLELLDAELSLHHGNAHEFAKKHGADDAMAKQLVDLIHNCAESSQGPTDPCEKTLNTAICFKAEIHKLNWAPNMDLLMGELLAEA